MRMFRIQQREKGKHVAKRNLQLRYTCLLLLSVIPSSTILLSSKVVVEAFSLNNHRLHQRLSSRQSKFQATHVLGLGRQGSLNPYTKVFSKSSETRSMIRLRATSDENASNNYNKEITTSSSTTTSATAPNGETKKNITSQQSITYENDLVINSDNGNNIIPSMSLEDSQQHLTLDALEKDLQPSNVVVGDNLIPFREQASAPSGYTSSSFDAAYVIFASAIIGIVSGFAVCLFKLSIESLRELLYGTSFSEHIPIYIIPALGGLGVSALASFGKFSSGLRGTANEIDALSINTLSDERFKNASSFIRKPLAAVFTLGSGNSLGPEGPSVEVGMSVSRIFMPPSPRFAGGTLAGGGGIQREETYEETAARIRRNRLLLSAGAASGVAAGFNAPLAGVFFALEIVQQYQPALLPPPAPISSVSFSSTSSIGSSAAENSSEKEAFNWFRSGPPDFLEGSGGITAILLSSVMSALVSQVYLGDSLALSVPSYDLKGPLMELPLYLMLGIISGVVAGIFSALAQLFKGIFDGDIGPMELRYTMTSIPKWAKPAMGGLIVGLIGTVYPQVLFFGYETLNTLLATKSVRTDLVLSLLAVKTFTTAISAGSGLVGGTFAPSLFLGGMVGAAFHNVVAQMFLTAHASTFELADVQAYALVGAAGVLAALFRAPLTASLLLFELTRDYGVILPVVASAGIGSIIGDLVEKNFEEKKRDRDAVSWGDLSDREDDEEQQQVRLQQNQDIITETNKNK